MSLFRRAPPHPDDLDTDDEEEGIDPNLRLRTVRTAASTIAESIQSEMRRENRRKRKNSRKSFFARGERKKHDATTTPPANAEEGQSGEPSQAKPILGKRRNIYINVPLRPEEVDQNGEPIIRFVRNKVRTSSTSHNPIIDLSCADPSLRVEYTVLTFLPKNLYEQFRRYVEVSFCYTLCDLSGVIIMTG